MILEAAWKPPRSGRSSGCSAGCEKNEQGLKGLCSFPLYSLFVNGYTRESLNKRRQY